MCNKIKKQKILSMGGPDLSMYTKLPWTLPSQDHKSLLPFLHKTDFNNLIYTVDKLLFHWRKKLVLFLE